MHRRLVPRILSLVTSQQREQERLQPDSVGPEPIGSGSSFCAVASRMLALIGTCPMIKALICHHINTRVLVLGHWLTLFLVVTLHKSPVSR